MSAQPLDLQRAEHALATIQRLEGEPCGHYVSYVRALPATILQNGLGQALATLLSSAKGKADSPHRWLHDHIHAWLCRDHADAPYRGKNNLIQAIVDGDEPAYLHAHAEALAYLVWLKKFAVAFLKQPDQGDAR